MSLYLIAIVLTKDIDTLKYGICGFIIDSSLVNNLNNHGKWMKDKMFQLFLSIYNCMLLSKSTRLDVQEHENL